MSELPAHHADDAIHEPVQDFGLTGHVSALDQLPPEQRLAMPVQDFSHRPLHVVPPDIAAGRRALFTRITVFASSLFVTAAFAYELYLVLSVVALTPVQIVFLVLCTLAFGWMTFGSMSAAMGFLPLFAGETADTIALPELGEQLAARTALLFPVYHEEPSRVAGTIAAVAEELREIGAERFFDVFVVSDTRGSEDGAREAIAYGALALSLRAILPVYYRRRPENTAKKAGNIADWVARFGGGYEHFIIFDADSIMAGETVVRLALAMQQDARAGLIQTVPRLIGGQTLFAKLQQFASNQYGPAVAAGIAVWHRGQGNYWGHNAIIRTRAFAEAAGLPDLPGRPPFGGHIQSHDFVEAACLVRAGWGVHIVPAARGSYEGCPPSLVDLIIRDRRWCQGNLQHAKIMTKRGIASMSRVHFGMGVLSYVVPGIWALSLVVGIVLALQAQQLIPNYFPGSKTLFPVWPIIDPGAALRLFIATLVLVMLPKGMGLALELKRLWLEKSAVTAYARAIFGVLTETIFSMLVAPILMVTQTKAVLEIMLGRDSGWKPQQRFGAAINAQEAARYHALHVVIGIIGVVLCATVSMALLAWMAPVLLGLVLSAVLSWVMARPPLALIGVLLSTEEDRDPPAIVARADALSEIWRERLSGPSARADELAQAA